MATFLFDEHVFGPIKNRRLGSSLGVNLLSTSQKMCNFNCVYCECGLTHQLTKGEPAFVGKDEFIQELEDKLVAAQMSKTPIDSITFAGNGEPTMHKDFLAIVKAIKRLRDAYYPCAMIAVLTNGYTLDQEQVKEGLALVDKAIIKLDSGDSILMEQINQPKGSFPIEKLMENIENFEGNLIIQTMFLKGCVERKAFDNSCGAPLDQWLEKIEELNPKEVMIYSLDRDTPIGTLEKIPKNELKAIAEKVAEFNIVKTVV